MLNHKVNNEIYEYINKIYCRILLTKDSLVINYVCSISIIIQVVAFSLLYPSNPDVGDVGDILFGFITIFVAILMGYYVHVFSHMIDYEELYLRIYNSSIWIRKLPKWFHFIISQFVFLIDFHDKIHHDTTINKTWYNILTEFLINLYTEGLCAIIMFKGLDFGLSIGGKLFKFNYTIIFAWCVLYATIHNINYNIITPVCHIQHHINNNTNFGIDFADILLGSKYDAIPEEMNHVAINVIMIMLLLIYLKSFYENKDNNLFMKILMWFISS